MNATPNINPASAAPVQPAAGKQQDAATPETPFSQVLSSEMAQNRRNSSAPKESSGADADATAPGARPTEADANSTAPVTVATPVTVTVTVTETVIETVAEIKESAADLLALPLAEDATIVPDALVALGIIPDQLKPAPTGTDSAATDDAPALATNNTLLFQDARKGRAPMIEQTEHLADKARSPQKADPALSSDKAAFQAASSAAATATAFSGQLAAARQAEAIKTREFVSELISNPAMRPAAQAPLDALPMQNDIATPRLTPTVGTTAWTQALGEKIVWMTAGAQQSATLTLNPPNMGPLQIVLNVSNEQATASFFSAQPEVRQALEAAFPRLREMMNEAGIQLGQATVSSESPPQHDTSERQAQRAAPPFPGADEAIAAGLQTGHAPLPQSGRGLIDTFA